MAKRKNSRKYYGVIYSVQVGDKRFVGGAKKQFGYIGYIQIKNAKNGCQDEISVALRENDYNGKWVAVKFFQDKKEWNAGVKLSENLKQAVFIPSASVMDFRKFDPNWHTGKRKGKSQ